MAPAKRKNGTNGNYVIMMDNFNTKLDAIKAENQKEHAELRIDIQRGSDRMIEKIDSLNSRIVKIETEPAHEKFQQVFCPNTQDIRDVVKWVDRHDIEVSKIYTKIEECEKRINTFIDVIKEERKNYDTERLRASVEGTKRMKTAILGMILTSVFSILVTVVTHFVGLW